MSSADALHRILSRRYPEYSWIVEVRPDADERQRALAARLFGKDACTDLKDARATFSPGDDNEGESDGRRD